MRTHASSGMDAIISWSQKQPSGWSVQRLKKVARIHPSNVDKKTSDGEDTVRLCNYTDVYYNEFITPDLDFMEASASAVEVKKFSLWGDEVIITKDSETSDDIAIPAYVSEALNGVLCGYHLALIRPKKDLISGRFLFRALQASGVRDQFYSSANGITRYGLGQESIANALVPLPPRDIQNTIASFLDRKTAAIDALIEKKQRLIKLLEEKRQAVISRAVTKGLDPNVKMKDSGVPWLGEIPAHWEVSKASSLCSVVSKGTTPPQGFADATAIPFVRVNNLTFSGALSLDNLVFVSDTTHRNELGRSRIYPGDVLMNIVGPPLGKVGVVGPEFPEYNANQAVAFFRVRRLLPHFLSSWLQSSFARDWFWLRAKKTSGQANLTLEHCRNVPVAVPPLDEQRSLLGRLARRLLCVDKPTSLISIQLKILQEYRQALITAAVTGKIDVRGEDGSGESVKESKGATNVIEN